MASKKGWLVVCQSYEYNDEVNTQSDGVRPQATFACKEEAERQCDKLNVAEFRTVDVWEYGYGLSDISDHDEYTITEQMRKILGDPEYVFCADDGTWDVPNADNLTDEQWLKIYNLFNIQFHRVIPIDIID